MARLASNGVVERHGFGKVNRILVVILAIIFIPISAFIIVTYSQTKNNSMLPTFTNYVVVQSSRNINSKKIKAGDKMIVQMISVEDLQTGQVVAYFVSEEDQKETGSSVNVGILQYIQDGTIKKFGIAGEEYLIEQDGLVGVYYSDSQFVVKALDLLSSQSALIFGAIVPLGVLLVLFVIELVELVELRNISREIQGASLKDLDNSNLSENTDSNNTNVQDDKLQEQIQEMQKASMPARPTNAQPNAVPARPAAPNGPMQSAVPPKAPPARAAQTSAAPARPAAAPARPANTTTNTEKNIPARPTAAANNATVATSQSATNSATAAPAKAQPTAAATNSANTKTAAANSAIAATKPASAVNSTSAASNPTTNKIATPQSDLPKMPPKKPN